MRLPNQIKADKLRFGFLLAALAFLLSVRAVHAQSAAIDEPLTNVTLSINLDTNKAIIGCSVLNLTVQVKNSSSNYVSIFNRSAPMAGTTFLYLTNSHGANYKIPWIERADFEQTRSHQTSRSIGPDSFYEWPLSAKIGNKIDGKEFMPGHYILFAVHEVITKDGKSHRLVSNSFGLELINFEDTYSWGAVSDGAQLSINLNSNVVVSGESNQLTARIKNLSTNTIFVLDGDKLSLSLSNSLGKVYELPVIVHLGWDAGLFLKAGDRLNQGDIKEWPITFTMEKQAGGKEVGPGTYFIQARRNFTTFGGQAHQLLSNAVEVQIIN